VFVLSYEDYVAVCHYFRDVYIVNLSALLDDKPDLIHVLDAIHTSFAARCHVVKNQKSLLYLWSWMLNRHPSAYFYVQQEIAK